MSISLKVHKIIFYKGFLKFLKSFFLCFETFLNKRFESLPRMIQSSTRLGGGHFFFETAELVVALGSSGGPSLCLPGRFAPKTARFARGRVPKKIKTFY